MKRFVSLATAACLLAVASVCSAVSDPHVSITWQDATGAGGEWSMVFEVGHDLRTGDAKQGAVSLTDAVDYQGLAGSGIESFNMSFDADRYVTGGFAVTNGSGSVMTYTIIFTSPVIPSLAAPTLYGGSMSGSFTADATPATVATVAQTPLYWGMIDGTPLLSIYDDSSTWTAPALGSGNIDAVNILPAAIVGPAANSNISIQYKFTLTPGDWATMNGAFVVIPEPATLVLLGLGGLFVRKKKVK